MSFTGYSYSCSLYYSWQLCVLLACIYIKHPVLQSSSSCLSLLVLSQLLHHFLPYLVGSPPMVTILLVYRVTSSDSPCPCAWHQQSLMLHVLAALCMTTYSMHTLVSCDPWITGSFSLICWKSHLYYTCDKCVCVLCCLPSEIGKAEFCGPL